MSSDFYQSAGIIWDLISGSLSSVHYMLIAILTIWALVVFFIAWYKGKASVILPFLCLIGIILLATSNYCSQLENNILEDNDRIVMSNRLYIVLSFVCNYLYVIARVIIYGLVFFYIVVVYLTVVEIHTTIGRKYPLKYIFPLIEWFTLFGPWFSIRQHTEVAFAEYDKKAPDPKRAKYDPNIKELFTDNDNEPQYLKANELYEKGDKLNKQITYFDGQVVQNPRFKKLYTLLTPDALFQSINSSDVSNWRAHAGIFLIGIILSIIYGMFGIDKPTCNTTLGNIPTDIEMKIKTQFVEGLIAVSLVMSVIYLIIYIWKAFS